ncbi:hypothetical protein GP486_008091 [Trichoglossum hirsutum]|uniref:Pru domain-containing protein n=1 Tax=Trichoglossum hirsutum TaxID=265104 RepID=A0A9P8IAJ2_9PEZI|nr:hypothetical protein GP486_008091 [Trichoglossum hirsutum]
MVPTDAHFIPYRKPAHPSSPSSPPINGRIFVLKFSSSSQRHFFWMQSKSQSAQGEPDYWSARDKKIGELIDQLLQGEDVDIFTALAAVPQEPYPDPDDDESMEDVEGTGHPGGHHEGGSGGAGPGATGGDIREEGEDAREGGADGARA